MSRVAIDVLRLWLFEGVPPCTNPAVRLCPSGSSFNPAAAPNCPHLSPLYPRLRIIPLSPRLLPLLSLSLPLSYEFLYKQAVDTADNFLGMSGKDGSSTSCEDLVVRVELPGAAGAAGR